ncbi:MAG: AMP-binding protein [Deltaproteobacteria bacterium]|nr:AMP-binding protein [Deltaproteobacteria bacterium]
MKKLTEYFTYKEVMKEFEWSLLWDLFDGDKKNMNISHECLDRHVDKGTAVRLKFADGHMERYTFKELSQWTSRFANYLENQGVEAGDRVCVMLEPSLAYYTCVFGAVKRGAIAVPLFTLFGPEALAQRINDCDPRILVLHPEKASLGAAFHGLKVLISGPKLFKEMEKESTSYKPETKTNDLAIFQYTSGTTREFPEAIKHTHRSVVTLALAALFGLGLREGDRYFCPSSPAWGHGMWHGTISPWSLGISAGHYSGKFNSQKILEALEEFEITNFAAAATVYRMLIKSGLMDNYRYNIQKLSFTGEPLDSATEDLIMERFGVPICSMYGTTETGVILASYPGFKDFHVKRGSLGKPVPGWEVAIIHDKGEVVPPGTLGEIAVKRRGEWFRSKDAGIMDEDGYFRHKGRSDDVIISAGWTISAVEVEDTLLKHPDIQEAAVIGVSDELRGHIVKAFLVGRRKGKAFEDELRDFIKTRLSAHEYPRAIEFVKEIPKTPAGKVNRKALRKIYING